MANLSKFGQCIPSDSSFCPSDSFAVSRRLSIVERNRMTTAMSSVAGCSNLLSSSGFFFCLHPVLSFTGVANNTSIFRRVKGCDWNFFFPIPRGNALLTLRRLTPAGSFAGQKYSQESPVVKPCSTKIYGRLPRPTSSTGKKTIRSPACGLVCVCCLEPHPLAQQLPIRLRFPHSDCTAPHSVYARHAPTSRSTRRC